jgi:hypothetical protein
MTKKNRYFPNKCAKLRAVPAELFEPIEFDEFMDWKIAGWMIPPDVLCIIREENQKNGRIKEYVYKREHAARKKANEIMDAGNNFIICTANQLNQMKPEEDWADDEYEEETDSRGRPL